MATKLTTGFMRTPTYKSSLDGNTTSLNMPSVFDSITKYKNIEASKILGEYTTYTPPSKGNTSGLKAIGWSTIKGFVDYTQYATDFALAQIQTAKSGLKSSIEQLKGTSSDPMKQTVYDTYNTKIQSATTLADRQAARRERDSKIKAMNEAENFRIRSDKEYDSGTPLLATARKKAEGFFQPKVDKLTEMADIENEGWFTQLLAEGFASTPYTVASKLNLFGFMLNFGSQEQRAIQEKMVQYQAEGRIMTPEAQQEIMTYATGSAVIEAAFEHMLPFAKGAMSITTLKNLGKFIVRQGGQESLEEILTYLGQGVLAKFTTDKMASLLDWTDKKGALITATGAGKSALAGFMMGSVYSGTAGLTGYVRTKRALKTIENSTLEEAGQPENVAKVDTAIKQDAQDQNNVDEIFDVVNDAAFTMSQNMDTETEAKVYESTVANLKQKASEQEYGSQERAETEATARTAEAHLKELYRQQQEAIKGEPTEREKVIIADLQTQPIERVKTLVNQLSEERTALFESARGDPETLASLDRIINAGNQIINAQTPVEGARSPVQEQVASDTVPVVETPVSGVQEPTAALQAETVSLSDWVSNTNAKAKLQAETAIDQLNQEFNSNNPDAIRIAEALYNLQRWQKTNGVTISQKASKAMSSINIYLSNNNIKIVDMTGQKYDAGLAVDVVYSDKNDLTNDAYISEMQQPIIIQNNKVVSFGKVMLSSQQPSVVTQEPTGASGNIDLRVESYEAEKQVFVAKKKNAKIAQTYLNNIKAKYNAEVDDAQELLQAYKDIERSDYESVEDYNDERESAWEEFIDAVDNIELEEIEQPTQQAQPKAESKVEQERATASETIAQESQKQDRSGIEGIVAPGTVAAMGNVPVQAKKQSWQDTISAETKQRFEDSSTPIDKEPIKERLSRWKEMFREYVTLGSVPIPVEMGDLRVEFRKMRTAFAQAKMKATRIIELSYNQVGKERFDLMSKAILYLDINEDLKKGLYNQGSAMQFGIKSPQEAIATIRAIVQEIRKPENQVVMDALKTRRRMMDSIRNDLLTQARKAGVDLELINNRKDYMYHAVIAYQQDFNRMAKSKKGKKRVEYLGRTGSIQDYVSDPVFSDYIIIGKMVSDTYRLRLFNEIKKQDISSTLKQAPTGEYIIPDGYSEMDVAMLGMPRLDHYSKQLIVRNASINLANLGIQKGSQAWNAAMKSAYAQANKNNVVVPESVVKAIEYEFGKKERYVGRSMKFVMNAWKYSKLRLPNVVIRYNIRNLMGDLDAMVIGNPVAMLKIPKAVTELYKFYYKKGVLTPALADFVESTGLVTGQTAQELKTLKSHSSFEFYDKSKKPADVVKRGVKKAWSVLTMETATDFREQILRYAAYLAFLEQVNRSKTGTLKNYAMSIPAEIDSITDVKEKAAKLANDMIGAYDDVSIFGQYAADHLMPFFRFKEINIKRYYRLTKNMFYTSPEVLQDVGTGIAGSLGKAGRVGAFTLMKMAKVAISVSLFYGALQLFNNLMSPEEEDKLPEDIKKRPHITLPAWLVGPNRVYYIDRLGSLAELLDIFGIDRSLGSDLNDVITGRMKLEDKMKEMLMSPVHDIFNSSFPLAKMSVELITGKELFPDPSNPKQMRDRWEYIFNQVGFRDEYKALAGKPIIEGSYTKQKRSIIFSSVVPGDAAYWDVYDMTDDFYKRHDISQRSSSWSDPSSKDAKKANAAYYYKVALKMQDTKAAERYLKEYVFYGGTKSTFESTMRSMAPLHWMSKTDKKLFFSEMTAQEKEQYDKAVAYFEELMKIKATSLP